MRCCGVPIECKELFGRRRRGRNGVEDQSGRFEEELEETGSGRCGESELRLSLAPKTLVGVGGVS